MIREIFNKVDHQLARRAAKGIGVPPPERDEAKPVSKRAPEVSVEHQKVPGVKTPKVAILAAEGFDHEALDTTKGAIEAAGARPMIVSKFLGTLEGEGGEVQVDKSYVTTASVLFDALFVVSSFSAGIPGRCRSHRSRSSDCRSMHLRWGAAAAAASLRNARMMFSSRSTTRPLG
jgi:hypothetical protein